MDEGTISWKCDFLMPDGSDCPVPASHFWGSVHACCPHFQAFALGLLKLKNMANPQPSHIEIVEEYNRQCGRTSLIPGTKCESND